MLQRIFFPFGDNQRAIGLVRREAVGQPQTLENSIPDGDTIGLHLEGSASVRFLGIDTPERQFDINPIRGGNSLDSDEWATYLTDPFDTGQFGPHSFDDELVAHLRTRLDQDAGRNHHLHAAQATNALRGLVQSDMTEMGLNLDTFGYFLSFSFEVFDANGRFLAYINRNQPDANVPGPRPSSYNDRMLEAGVALPYFIWPNIDPFRSRSLLDAVIPPGEANQVAQATPALRRARTFVQSARANGIGVFDQANPLQLEAFEIRFLGRRVPPSRPVIDLSSASNMILKPQSYFRIPNPEDRLFLPPAFVPLFVSRGWRLEGWS